MSELLNRTVGEIVAEDYRTARVFKSNKIDFCCNGNIILGDICKKKDLDSVYIIKQLNNIAVNNSKQPLDYQNWRLDILAEYIERKHHRYIEEVSPTLVMFLDKLCKVHGKNHPELFDIEMLFNRSAGELATHMKKEELLLFPFIKKLVKAKQNKEKIVPPKFGSVSHLIQSMKNEHIDEGERFRNIAKLSSDFKTPADGCNTYKVSFSMLREFDEDLQLHIHLENNILFPQAVELENELLK